MLQNKRIKIAVLVNPVNQLVLRLEIVNRHACTLPIVIIVYDDNPTRHHLLVMNRLSATEPKSIIGRSGIPGDEAPFLGPGRFVKNIHQESIPPPSSRPITLKDLLKSAAAKSGLSAEILLRKGRLGSVVNARDRFVRDAVLQHGYLACQVASFLNCHPSNVSRALQKS